MTIKGYPPALRVEPSPDIILSGAPVSAVRTWQYVGAGVNWLNGGSAMLIPGISTTATSIASTATGTYRFKVKPRAQAVERVWCLQLVGTPAAGKPTATATITCNSAAAVTYTLPTSRTVNAPLIIREPLAAQTNALTELVLTIVSTDGSTVLQSLTCFEQFRVSLEPSADDRGFNFQSVRPRERVSKGDPPTTIESVGGAYYALSGADARRAGQFHFVTPTQSPITRSGAYVDVLIDTVPILTRKLTSGQTTGKVWWSAYAKVSASSGDINVTSTHSGVNDTVNITGTSFAWTTPRDILVDCEDLSKTDGLQGSSTWDELRWQYRGNGGATISIASISLWEE